MDRVSNNPSVDNSHAGDAAPLETSWQSELAAGHTAAALQHYQGSEHLDEEVLAALKALHDVRCYLRAKRWAKAKRALVDVETPPRSVADKVDMAALTQQLETLQATNKLLDQHKPEAALERLEHVTSPLLSAEAETQRGTAYIFWMRSRRPKPPLPTRSSTTPSTTAP